MEPLSHTELSRLTPSERLALISQLWNSLENDQLPLSTAQKDELDRRLATLEADRQGSMTWGAMKSELESRCP